MSALDVARANIMNFKLLTASIALALARGAPAARPGGPAGGRIPRVIYMTHGADRGAEGRRRAPAARHRLVVHLLQSGAQRRGELGVGAGEAALVRGEGRQRGDGHA